MTEGERVLDGVGVGVGGDERVRAKDLREEALLQAVLRELTEGPPPVKLAVAEGLGVREGEEDTLGKLLLEGSRESRLEGVEVGVLWDETVPPQGVRLSCSCVKVTFPVPLPLPLLEGVAISLVKTPIV